MASPITVSGHVASIQAPPETTSQATEHTHQGATCTFSGRETTVCSPQSEPLSAQPMVHRDFTKEIGSALDKVIAIYKNRQQEQYYELARKFYLVVERTIEEHCIPHGCEAHAMLIDMPDYFLRLGKLHNHLRQTRDDALAATDAIKKCAQSEYPTSEKEIDTLHNALAQKLDAFIKEFKTVVEYGAQELRESSETEQHARARMMCMHTNHHKCTPDPALYEYLMTIGSVYGRIFYITPPQQRSQYMEEGTGLYAIRHVWNAFCDFCNNQTELRDMKFSYWSIFQPHNASDWLPSNHTSGLWRIMW